MRTFDIPYTQNPPDRYLIPENLDNLDLRTLTKTYLCGKSHGKVSECMRCSVPCAYGKRALELLGKLDPTAKPAQPPLVNGKTLLERAREQVAKDREENTNLKRDKMGRVFMDGWFEKARENENPIQWIMDTFNLTKTKAKQKVYSYQHAHPEMEVDKLILPRKSNRETMPKVKIEVQNTEKVNVEEPKVEEEVKEEIKEETKEEVKEKPEALFAPLEEKINTLMNLQEQYKKEMERYQKLYQETTIKVNALYEALSILNE